MNSSDIASRESPFSGSITFGPFELQPGKRLLLNNGMPVEVGSRALDVLIALIAHAGQVISNRDLVRMVWHDVVVDESCLRVHISGLRKALSCTETDVSYIANVPGRGYSFVASAVPSSTAQGVGDALANASYGTIPPCLERMIGRDKLIVTLAEQLGRHRFLTICGTGGIGKSAVAVAVSYQMRTHLDTHLLYIDASALNNLRMLLCVLGSALGVTCHNDDLLTEISCALTERKLLITLDNCDHVVEDVTFITEHLYALKSDVYLLVTCREPLRAEGEHAHRLSSLACPPETTAASASFVRSFPAVQLFVERVMSNQSDFVLEDLDAPLVAEICRKLDGMALAIELAAGQVAAFGIQGVADLLANRLSLYWSGRRRAEPRHQTLNSVFDWSFDVLSTTEALVLRRLAVLNGPFTLEVAAQVVNFETDETSALDAIGRLVSKSLIMIERKGKPIRYRLPYMLQAYALEKLRTSGESDLVTERHALYLITLLEHLNVQGETLPDYERIQRYVEHLGDICTTLDWAFSEPGNIGLGIRLAAASSPLFLGLSMLDECRRWSGRALAAGVCEPHGLPQETAWQEALAISSMFALGKPHSARSCTSVGQIFDENLGDTLRQLRTLAGSNTADVATGMRGEASRVAETLSLSAHIADPKGIAMMQWMLSDSDHTDHAARTHNPSAHYANGKLARISSQLSRDEFSFSYDYRVRALSSLARVSWLRGYPDQAARIGRQALERANNLRHPATICLSLIYVSTVFLWMGDWKSARETIDRLNSLARLNSFEPDLAVGLGLEGILLYSQGEIDAGVRQLNGCLSRLSVENHQVLATMFIRCLAEGFAAAGRFDNALEIVSGALEMIDNIGETFDTPEILRIAADFHAAKPCADFVLAEQYLKRSIACAVRQSALAWELRAATSLTRLHLKQGRIIEAGKLLQSVYSRFSEGFDSLDLREAKATLIKANNERSSHMARSVTGFERP